MCVCLFYLSIRPGHKLKSSKPESTVVGQCNKMQLLLFYSLATSGSVSEGTVAKSGDEKTLFCEI